MSTTAFIGCAHIHTPEFVRMATNHPATELAVVWDHRRSRAEEIGRSLGVAVASEPDDIWHDEKIDAVFICSETVRHRELVEAALRAGKHLFVEKPLAADGAGAAALAAAIEKAGVLFQTGFFMRSKAVHRFLRGAITEGRLGHVMRIRVANWNPAALEGWFDDHRWRWMADPALAGLGGFGDEGAHAADLLLWLLGHPRLERVAAAIGPAVGRYGAIDELGEALLRFEGGILASIAAGWVHPENAVTIEVSGTTGHARVEGGELYITSDEASSGGTPGREKRTADLPHAFELFLDALAGRADAPLVSARDAAAASTVLDAAYRAAREEAWVKPPRAVGGGP